MKFKRFCHGTLGFLTASSVAWSCSSQSSDCTANKDCEPYGAAGQSGGSGRGESGSSGESGGGNTDAGASGSGEGGASGMGGEGGGSGMTTGGNGGAGGAPCDGSASPETSACVIDDKYGLFVSLTGNDVTGDGSQARPLATVSKALSLTGPEKINRLYVCATPSATVTNYTETSTLVIPDRVSIYGGFACDGTWSYDPTLKARIRSSSPIGATISNSQVGVIVQDVRLDAAPAPDDGTGASSFGMLITASKGVSLTRVEIRAGKGGGGAAGADGVAGADGDVAGAAQNGQPSACNVGKTSGGTWAVFSACGSLGGAGGDSFPTQVGTSGQPGAPMQNVTPPDKKNGGAVATAANTPGDAGVFGALGVSGVPGSLAKPLGAFSSGGYLHADGGSGTNGYVGQGGGGGGASAGNSGSNCAGAGGGAGGMGGCGGQLGAGGLGGGASVALLSWNSVVVLNESTFIAAAGGAGGKGGSGGLGGAGARGGTGGVGTPGKSIGDAGDGGKGGSGGNGGNGAGGSGGPSLALVYSGTKPIETATTLTAALGGSAGMGGQVGISPGPNGSAGFSQAEYEQK